MFFLPQRVMSAQSLGCCKLGILTPRKSKTMHVCSLFAAQSVCGMMPTHQLARSIQGVMWPNNSEGSVGPLLAAIENIISFVGAPLSVFALPRWCQDLSPKNLPKKLAKLFPLLALSSGPVLRTGWGCGVAGLAPQTGQLPAQPDRQTNKQKSQRK